RLHGIFSDDRQDHFEEIEEVLYTSDLGPQTVERLMESVKSELSRDEKKDIDVIKRAMKSEFEEIFEKAQMTEPIAADAMALLNLSPKPTVWMVVGVNGAGKTTSIGKMAAHLANSGKKVLVAAGDTFRAAAGNQLKAWTDRAQVEIFSPPGVTDPSAVAFDAVAKAEAKGYDIVIVDTAGRLHTQTNLMEELKKMKRVMSKVIPSAPHEVLIVLDANSGQNALMQAKEFHKALGLTGVVLTKMDGTAKGGVAVGLANELQIPIRLIGVGEKIGDLKAFSA
ncbi:MAG: signal recognition particle-docking protein FtsY, partial [Bdellovibrio sp. CG10_big_fil_rev_8_21_14_0_10_47_8]